MVEPQLPEGFQLGLFWHSVKFLALTMGCKSARPRTRPRSDRFWVFITACAPASFSEAQMAAVGCRPDDAIRVIAADRNLLPTSADVLPVTLMQAWRFELIDKHGNLTNARRALMRVAADACDCLGWQRPALSKGLKPHELRYAVVEAMQHRKLDIGRYLPGA